MDQQVDDQAQISQGGQRAVDQKAHVVGDDLQRPAVELQQGLARSAMGGQVPHVAGCHGQAGHWAMGEIGHVAEENLGEFWRHIGCGKRGIGQQRGSGRVMIGRHRRYPRVYG